MMKQFFGIIFILSALSITAFAGGHSYVDSNYNDGTEVYLEDDTKEFVYDYSELPDSTFFCDSVDDEEIFIGVETISGDTLDSSVSESLADRYAGLSFTVKGRDGAEYNIEVNGDGMTATLVGGNANGNETLVIPSTVEGLGSSFALTDIDDFAYMTHRTEGIIPMNGVKLLILSEGIISVGQNCFEAAPDLEKVILPASLSNISYEMFANCPELRQVIIPEESGIIEIGSFSFEDCKSLDSFYIPSAVSMIGEGPWRGCISLEKITLSESNYNFVVQDGVLYSDWQGNLIQYPAGKKDAEYHPLYGTLMINNSAFYGNPFLKSVTMPASLNFISHIAFYDCASLSNVIFSGALQDIGNRAFRDCPSLQSMTLYGIPQYTIDKDYYNTFDATTRVIIDDKVPPVALAKSKSGILSAALEYVAGMPYFRSEVIDNNENYGFPNYFGKGKAAIYGNSGPLPDVLHVLESIPSSCLAAENVDDRGRITRIYLDKSKKKHPRVLYFFGGTGGNDLVVALFEDGDLKMIEKMIEDANKAHSKGE